MPTITCYGNDKFSYIIYDKIKIIIMKSNNYVNATRLCELRGRKFTNWKKLSESKILVDNVKKINDKTNQLKTDMIIYVKDIDHKGRDTCGYYVHQDLVSSISNWISPLFAVKVNKIINYYICNEYDIRLSEMESDMTEVIDVVDKLVGGYNDEIAEIIYLFNKFIEKYIANISLSTELSSILNNFINFNKKYNNDIKDIKSLILDLKNTSIKLDKKLFDKDNNESNDEKLETEVDKLIFFI
ncbi:p28-like protein [Fowlpox virus]|nr:p28-like protein [Fowlpox virus]AXY05122.1 p28-like protein [Fowlpox virus]